MDKNYILSSIILSTGTFGQHSMTTLSEMTSDSDVTAHRSGSSSSAFSFESRGVGRSIHVVKRDGVFKSVDKYAPGRYVMREATLTPAAGACDYEIYTLPYPDENHTQMPIKEISASKSRADMARRLIRVSWGAEVHQDGDSTQGEGDNPRQVSVSPAKRPAQPEDTFAFRKPVYSSGKSRVSEVGVMWKIPTADGSTPKPPTAKEIPKTPEKPMWSWLVTQEEKRKSSRTGKRRVATTAPVVRSQTTSGKLQRSRDLHPVSTGLEREGTSVSKTKWRVPSGVPSPLDMGRSVLELVKRPGSQLMC